MYRLTKSWIVTEKPSRRYTRLFDTYIIRISPDRNTKYWMNFSKCLLYDSKWSCITCTRTESHWQSEISWYLINHQRTITIFRVFCCEMWKCLTKCFSHSYFRIVSCKVFMVTSSMSDFFFLEQTLTRNMQNLHSTLHLKPSNEFAQWI